MLGVFLVEDESIIRETLRDMFPWTQQGYRFLGEASASIRDGLVAHFLKYPEYILFRWNLTTYAVLIKGETGKIGSYVQRCIQTVQKLYETYDPERNWYVAAGTVTNRLSSLSQCFNEVSRLWAYRLILPKQHIPDR